MGQKLAKAVLAGLVLLHVGLLVWALMGTAELLLGDVPWTPVANPLFPPLMLAGHWLSVLYTSIVFLLGTFYRWPLTPPATVAGYGAMALVCLIETTQFLVHDGRWLAMTLEYAAYIAITLFLFGSAYMRGYFRPVSAA